MRTCFTAQACSICLKMFLSGLCRFCMTPTMLSPWQARVALHTWPVMTRGYGARLFCSTSAQGQFVFCDEQFTWVSSLVYTGTSRPHSAHRVASLLFPVCEVRCVISPLNYAILIILYCVNAGTTAVFGTTIGRIASHCVFPASSSCGAANRMHAFFFRFLPIASWSIFTFDCVSLCCQDATENHANNMYIYITMLQVRVLSEPAFQLNNHHQSNCSRSKPRLCDRLVKVKHVDVRIITGTHGVFNRVVR